MKVEYEIDNDRVNKLIKVALEQSHSIIAKMNRALEFPLVHIDKDALFKPLEEGEFVYGFIGVSTVAREPFMTKLQSDEFGRGVLKSIHEAIAQGSTPVIVMLMDGDNMVGLLVVPCLIVAVPKPRSGNTAN